MSKAADAFKHVAKQWVRPLLVPVVRTCVRYAPHESIRRAVWAYVVTPFFQYSNSPFVSTTVFGATMAGNTEDRIQRHLFYFGVWEPNLTEFLRGRLREGDVFVDVGANIGYFTLLASRLVGPTGKVLAIEASPKIFAKLSDNLTRNRSNNVEAINAAASDRKGTVQIFFASDANIGATSTISRKGSSYECDMAADSLDALLAQKAVTNVRFVKIDVEGAEWLVVAGMGGLLKSARPDLEVLVELMPTFLHAHGKTVEDVFAIFAGYGFWPYHIENDYEIQGYMSLHGGTRPARIRTPISGQIDVIFSKVDADYL
jgi:FkbM family methyltransferase